MAKPPTLQGAGCPQRSLETKCQNLQDWDMTSVKWQCLLAFHLGFSLQKCVAHSLKDCLPVLLEESIYKERRKEVK